MSPRLLYIATEDWFFRSHFLPMARAARAAGFEVALATRLRKAAPALAAEGIRLLPLELGRAAADPRAVAREVRATRRLLRAERPDILHLVALKPVLVGGLAALGLPLRGVVHAVTGVGIVGIERGARAMLTRVLLRAAIGPLLRRKNAWVLVENAADARSFGRPPPARVRQVGGAGIDPEHFAPLPPPARASAAVVARMLWSKGIDTAVAAQERLARRGMALELALAGPVDADNPNGFSAATLAEWAARPGVRWLGRVGDVRAVWRDAAIAVLASRGGEGLPRSLLEAAACGRPIVTTDVPGCRDFVRAGIEGLVVPPDDPAALADALATLAADPELRRRMGEAARARVLAGYTETQVGAAVAALYRAILAA